MTKAFVDTTVLTDALLKTGEKAIAAKAAIANFTETQLPVYAIKEFKRGPLAAYKWLHNKFASEGSYHRTLSAVQAIAGTPQRYRVSTALEALASISRSIGAQRLGEFNEKYSGRLTLDEIQAREARIRLRKVILKAWAKRRKLTTKVVCPLSCYREADPTDERGQIVLDPTECVGANCCMRSDFVKKIDDIKAMRDALATLQEPVSHEQTKRLRVLKDLSRTPKRELSHEACRSLGDAVFAFYAPNDATILTTNVRDHQPLAEALGKTVTSP